MKCTPSTPEEYEKANTKSLRNFAEWGKFMREYRGNSNYDIYNDLLGDNRAAFETILGAKSCQWQGYIKWDQTVE